MLKRHTCVSGIVAVALISSATAWPFAADQQGNPTRPAAGLRLEVAAGSKASYRVREQLVGFDLPGDAVGTTETLTGTLVLAADGSIAGDSKLTADLRTLKSDQGMRDGFIQRRTLETERFPLAEFVPRRIEGLSFPLPGSGERTFRLIGNMTVHGVTSELTWNVVATFAADHIAAQAKTNFPFATFGLAIPRVGRVLSINDNIQIELDLRLRRNASP